MLETLLRYIVPSIVSASVGLIVLWYTLHAQTKKDAKAAALKLAVVTKDDAADLREDLMAERKQFVAEIKALQDRCDALEQARCPLLELQDVKKRCDALEETNRNQAVELERQHQQNKALIHEIKSFGSGLVEDVGAGG